jgi:hypothetical protein
MKPCSSLLFIWLMASGSLFAQIWEPEGLNLPGQWNSWQNPPVNNLALASSTQVQGGRVIKISQGIVRWQTIFSVAASGADIVGGTYNWLFTSGPATSPWTNKWAGVTVQMNTLQSYNYNNGADNSITVTNGKWYTMNWEDKGYMNSRAIFMETSAQPVQLQAVSVPTGIIPGQSATIDIMLSAPPSAGELIYLRYTNNAWASSSLIPVQLSGSMGTAMIPGQAQGTIVRYYVFSTTVSNPTADFDLYSIRLNNNNGSFYSYTVGNTPQPEITFANLQWPPTGIINPGNPFVVYGRVFADGITNLPGAGQGLQAELGVSSTNTNPMGWSNWLPMDYHLDVEGQDEYLIDLGAAWQYTGTWHYATRYRIGSQAWVYGGFSVTGGGFWNGTTNISGQLIITNNPTSWPVTFTLTDGTATLSNVKFKGSMTNWETLPMTQSGNQWTITLNISPGSYEWGAIEDNGTQWGIWLIDGPNLQVSIDVNGVISGTTSYTSMVVSLPQIEKPVIRMYPNPAKDYVMIKGAKDSQIIVFNLEGKRLFDFYGNSDEFYFDLSNLPTGIYKIVFRLNSFILPHTFFLCR